MAMAVSTPHPSNPSAVSQTNTPSHPLSSASTASSTCSAVDPPGNTNPNRTALFKRDEVDELLDRADERRFEVGVALHRGQQPPPDVTRVALAEDATHTFLPRCA